MFKKYYSLIDVLINMVFPYKKGKNGWHAERQCRSRWLTLGNIREIQSNMFEQQTETHIDEESVVYQVLWV